MGMAASQARLLTLTARIHDVEYEAQALQNAKVQLSNQSDYIYQEYLEALDATTLTISAMDNAGNTSNVTATFNTLCSLNKVQASNGKGYALFDSRGRLIVDDDIYQAYKEFSTVSSDYDNDITFAMSAMDIDIASDSVSIFDAEKEVYDALDKKDDSQLAKAYNNVVDVMKSICEKRDITVSSYDIYSNNFLETNEKVTDEDRQLYENALYAFRTQLYKEQGEAIYAEAGGKKEDFDYSTFQYYVSIFHQIEQAGGCVPISDFDNEDSYSNAANNSEWLKAMIECGKITMAQVNTNAKSGEEVFTTTSPSSDSAVSYTQTTSIDKTALAKAEAEYEHNMAIINKKDERFDLELSKLEAERTALTTEYDSVKKVIEDNIDRTFGIFS